MAKLAFFFHLFCGLFSLVVCIGLWFAADRTGTRDQIESFLGDLLGTKNFVLFGDKLLRAAAGVTIGLILLATVGTVLMAFIYNMLSGIFGGVVVSVLQERLLAPTGVAELSTTPAPRAPLSRRQRRKRRRARRRARPEPVVSSSVNTVASDTVATEELSSTAAFEHADQGLTLHGQHADMAEGRALGSPDEPPDSLPSDQAEDSNNDWLSTAADPTGSWMAPGVADGRR